jgi:hypothetical protein
MSTVDQTTTGTAAMARRLVRRTLTIMGGSVAGTAIVWAISSASASADPAGTPCEATTLGLGVERLADNQVSEVVCSVRQLVPAPEVTDLGTGATSAAGEFGRQLTGQLGRVPEVSVDLGAFGRGDRHGADTVPGGGTHESPSLVRPVGEPSAAAPAPVDTNLSADRPAAGSATGRAVGDGMVRRGSPERAPFAPAAPVPPAPATVPASGSGGHPTGGGDTPVFAPLGSTGRQLDLDSGRSLPVIDVLSFGEPGARPGVTPD